MDEIKEIEMNIDKFKKNLNDVDAIRDELDNATKLLETYNTKLSNAFISIEKNNEDNIKNIGANMELQDFVGAISTDQKKIYYFGIIDFFTTWNTTKKAEKLYKTVVLGSSTGISAIKPEAYATRFIQFLISRISSGV